MLLEIDKGFLWRTIVVSLLVGDLFLWSTGNPSIAYYILGGGEFGCILPLIAIVLITASYLQRVITRKASKRYFVLHVLFLAALVFALSKVGPYATRRASTRIQAAVDLFVKEPMTSTVGVSNEHRRLMLKIRQQNFTIQREPLSPTIRKGFYFLRTHQGESYDLVIDMTWIGAPEVWLGRVDGGHSGTL